jgi:hypothetical protein
LGRLIAGGDSFTYGSELKDCFILCEGSLPKEVYSYNSYSALLARELNLEYVCAAHPGYSNSAIRRNTMDICEQYNDIELVIVMWSFPNRYEFKFDHAWEQITLWSIEENVEERIKSEFHNENPIVFDAHLQKLKRERELGITDFAKSFYRSVGYTEFWECYSSLVDIVMLTNYLKLRNIPYLFTGVDSCLLNNANRYSNDLSMKTLLAQLDLKNWYWFPNERGFYTWAKEERFPFATTHPREEAHTEAAHLIYEHLRYIGRLP